MDDKVVVSVEYKVFFTQEKPQATSQLSRALFQTLAYLLSVMPSSTSKFPVQVGESQRQCCRSGATKGILISAGDQWRGDPPPHTPATGYGIAA